MSSFDIAIQRKYKDRSWFSIMSAVVVETGHVTEWRLTSPCRAAPVGRATERWVVEGWPACHSSDAARRPLSCSRVRRVQSDPTSRSGHSRRQLPPVGLSVHNNKTHFFHYSCCCRTKQYSTIQSEL